MITKLSFWTLTTSTEMEIKLYHMKVTNKGFAHEQRGNDVEQHGFEYYGEHKKPYTVWRFLPEMSLLTDKWRL